MLGDFYLFFFYCSLDHQVLLSFPTRRSSDLAVGDVDRDALLPLGPQAVGEQREVHVVVTLGLARRLDRLELVGEDRLRVVRSEEHTSELQSHVNLVCRLLLEKKK